MKRIFAIIALLAALLLAGACHAEIEERIADLKEQLTDLETRISVLNESISTLSSLISALEKNDHIASITEIPGSGKTKYRVTFTSGSTLLLTSGDDGVSPIVGVRYNEEYEAYYWTLQMGPDGKPSWMTNSYGMRVRASGTVPRLKIEDNTWYYSFDGNSWNKCNWAPAQGNPGTSLFSLIDTSNPYYVVFMLAGSGYEAFRIPTQKALDELNEQCEDINKSIASYSKLIEKLDPSIFVQSVSEFEEDGVKGCHITLESGDVLTIRDGQSSRDSVLLSARADTDGKYYWVFRSRSDQAFQWLLYKGEKVCVSQEDVTPTLGLTESLGHIYFTITFQGHTELMKDAKGNPVEATGRVVLDFFTGADTSDPYYVSLKMSDGSEIRLPKALNHPLSVRFLKQSSEVKPMTSYSYRLLALVTDTLPSTEPIDYSTYAKRFYIKTDAIALDEGCIVSEPKVVIFESAAVEAGRAYSIYYDIPFETGDATYWDSTRPLRIAFFLSWQNNSLVKVAEFERQIPATSISVSPTSLPLKTGQTHKLSYFITPENTTDTLATWSSSNPSIATVSDKGLVTAVAPGTCNITVKAGKVSATCKVTVTAATTVSLNKTSLDLTVGGSFTLIATVTPSEKAAGLEWTTDKSGVATVVNGLVTGAGPGTCTIKAKVDGVEAYCAVTVH